MNNKNLEVRGKRIRMKKIKGNEMFSLNDISNQFGGGNAADKIYSWFKNQNTLEFLEAFELENNPIIKKSKLKKFIKEAKQNKFSWKLEDFEKVTNSPHVSSRLKREGSWAVFEVAAKFMMWISPKFEVWFMSDYKKMKIEETLKILNQEQFFAQKNVDNLLETLRFEQDRLRKIKDAQNKLNP